MTRQKKQKVYLAVLGLAVVAFVLDRTLLDASTTAPATATAALRNRQAKKVQDAKQPGAAAEKDAQQAQAQSDPSRRVSISRQIALACQAETSSSQDPCPDAFAASPLWVAVEVQQEQQEQASREKVALENLKSRYTLTAVISGKSGMAILGGRCVRVGQSIEGCTLVEVTGQRAIFQAGQDRVELRVPQ